jgi:integrase
VRRHQLSTPSRETISDALDTLIAGMRDGTIRAQRKGGNQPYKPSAIRSYAQSIEKLRPVFGSTRVSELTRNDVQDYIDELVAEGQRGQTVRNTIMPLRVLYRRAVKRGQVAVNPMLDLDLPESDGKRERVAPPSEAVELLNAMTEANDRALWATALYAGLRVGELQALQVEDVELEAGVIHVRRSWDRVEGFVAPKSKAGARDIFICQHLREHLEAHEAPSEGFYFGRTDGPFDYWSAVTRARKAWDAAELERINPHEARHTFASYLGAAGVPETRIDRYMGHANVTVRSRYQHLLDGQLGADAALLNEYLDAAEGGAVIVPLVVATKSAA